LFDLDQVPLYPENDNEFVDEDELSDINESDKNNSDLNKSQEEKDDNSSNYNYNIKELIAEMMWDNSDYSTVEDDQ
ncbi:9243_t:CDS:1, partial [Funneliformis geosporum]